MPWPLQKGWTAATGLPSGPHCLTKTDFPGRPTPGLPSSRLRELAALGSPEAILDALPEPLRASLRGAPDIPGIFSRMEVAAAEVAAKVLHSGAPAIARAFAYLILRERDLRAVRAILRGRHLKLPVADIRLAMYRSSEEGNA